MSVLQRFVRNAFEAATVSSKLGRLSDKEHVLSKVKVFALAFAGKAEQLQSIPRGSASVAETGSAVNRPTLPDDAMNSDGEDAVAVNFCDSTGFCGWQTDSTFTDTDPPGMLCSQ